MKMSNISIGVLKEEVKENGTEATFSELTAVFSSRRQLTNSRSPMNHKNQKKKAMYRHIIGNRENQRQREPRKSSQRQKAVYFRRSNSLLHSQQQLWKPKN